MTRRRVLYKANQYYRVLMKLSTGADLEASP